MKLNCIQPRPAFVRRQAARRMFCAARRTGLSALFAATFLFAGCVMKPDTEKWLDAYTELDGAINFKAKECGQRPAYPIILPPNPPSYGLRLCTLTIIRLECPFNDYPLFCLEMYGIDLPGIGPKQ